MDEDEFIMARRYNVLERFSEYETRGDQGMVREMRGEGRCGAPMTCTDMIWSPFLDSLDKVQQCNIEYYQGRIKEERACNLGNTRIHMWAGECA